MKKLSLLTILLIFCFTSYTQSIKKVQRFSQGYYQIRDIILDFDLSNLPQRFSITKMDDSDSLTFQILSRSIPYNYTAVMFSHNKVYACNVELTYYHKRLKSITVRNSEEQMTFFIGETPTFNTLYDSNR